ncbi:MAG: NAD-dependent epimerase/dehydratase family protein [Actinobacteria bacterium]|nr:NAD-dependent epimerase/dehydratase family protein [Actinomycetota bacterium]
MTSILVTGGAGFIGSNLSDRLLAEGHRVVAVDDLSGGRIANMAEARSYGKEFTFHNLDVRSEAMLTLFQRSRPEVVMHLAAQPGVRPSIEDPVHDASVNVMGLLNVLESAARTGVRKVVFASSGGTIYGEPRRLPVKETAIGGSRPLSPYGITKKVAEDYLRYFQRYRGLDFTALAVGNVYGPRQDPHGEAGVIAIFAGKMLAGEAPAIFGDGNQTRDYVFIDDAVHAFALAADRGSGRLLNIGTGLETSVNGLFRMLAGIVGFHGEPQRAPQPPGELRRMCLDHELASQELGWRPWTHLEDGLAETVAYLREQQG